MGINACFKKKTAVYEFESNTIIRSTYDDYFIPIEKKNNLSDCICFHAFIKLLEFSKFPLQIDGVNNIDKIIFNKINNTIPELNKTITSNYFKGFMEFLESEKNDKSSVNTYSYKNYQVTETEDNTTFWISFFTQEFDYLNNYGQYQFGELKVIHIIPFLLLWCSGLLKNKYKTLFYCLCDQDGVLKDTKKFKDLIIELIVISSIGLYDTSHEIKKHFKVNNDKFYVMNEIYQYNNIKKLTDEIYYKIFGTKIQLTYKEFKKDHKSLFSFLFNSKWIRAKLEKINKKREKQDNINNINNSNQ